MEQLKGDVSKLIKELEETRKEIRFMASDMVDLKVLQGQNHVILKEHIRRTEANEKLIRTTENKLDKRLDRMENFKWYFGGLAVFVGAIMSYISKIL